MKKLFDCAFYLLFKLFSIGRKEKSEAAFVAILFLGFPVGLNILTFTRLIKNIFNTESPIIFKLDIEIVLVSILAYLPFLNILINKKYFEIEKRFDGIGQNIKLKYALLYLVYLLITMLVFFASKFL